MHFPHLGANIKKSKSLSQTQCPFLVQLAQTLAVVTRDGSGVTCSQLHEAPQSALRLLGHVLLERSCADSVCELAFFVSSANRGIQEAMVHHG